MLPFTSLARFAGRIAAGLALICLAACAVVTTQPAPAPQPTASPLAPSPTAPATLTPTPDPIPARVRADLPAPLLGQNWWRSPDGQWLVEDLNAAAADRRAATLKVVRVDGQAEWQVPDLPLAPGATRSPQSWTRDGQWLYILTTNPPSGDLSQAACRVDSIRRLNLRSGAVEAFLDYANFCWDAAFSPDGASLAYVTPSTPPQLVLFDLQSQQTRTHLLPEPCSHAGGLAWAPDAAQLLMIVTCRDQSSLDWVRTGGAALSVQEVVVRTGYLSLRDWQGDRVAISQWTDAKSPAYEWEVSLGKQSARLLSTSGPSPTPTRAVTPTQTLTPSRTPTPGPNWMTVMAPTQTVPAIIQTDLPYYAPGYSWWHSPDGKWLAEDMSFVKLPPGFDRGNVLRVMSVDGKVQWKVDFLGKEVRASAYRPVAWSKDGNFVYIEYRVGYKDGPIFMYCDADGIRRLDLRSGAITSFLEAPGASGPEACWAYAFSADALKLAYITPPPGQRQLVVIDLNSGQKLTYKFDPVYAGVGRIRWGADQKQLVLQAEQSDSTRPVTNPLDPPIKSSLFWVRLEGETLNVQEVFNGSGMIFLEGWKGDRVVIRQGNLSNQDAWWEVYLSSKQAIQIPALTPTPQGQ